jgi:hypothetical protein
MSRGIIALVLISLLALLIIGCKASAPGTPVGTPTGTGTPATETGKATNTSITGDISDVDTTVSELNNSDIQDTDSLINEVKW